MIICIKILFLFLLFLSLLLFLVFLMSLFLLSKAFLWLLFLLVLLFSVFLSFSTAVVHFVSFAICPVLMLFSIYIVVKIRITITASLICFINLLILYFTDVFLIKHLLSSHKRFACLFIFLFCVLSWNCRVKIHNLIAFLKFPKKFSDLSIYYYFNVISHFILTFTIITHVIINLF